MPRAWRRLGRWRHSNGVWLHLVFDALADDADTTAWYAIDFWVDTQGWQTRGLDYVFLPSLILGDTLLDVPVRVSGEGIVSFGTKH